MQKSRFYHFYRPIIALCIRTWYATHSIVKTSNTYKHINQSAKYLLNPLYLCLIMQWRFHTFSLEDSFFIGWHPFALLLWYLIFYNEFRHNGQYQTLTSAFKSWHSTRGSLSRITYSPTYSHLSDSNLIITVLGSGLEYSSFPRLLSNPKTFPGLRKIKPGAHGAHGKNGFSSDLSPHKYACPLVPISRLALAVLCQRASSAWGGPPNVVANISRWNVCHTLMPVISGSCCSRGIWSIRRVMDVGHELGYCGGGWVAYSRS